MSETQTDSEGMHQMDAAADKWLDDPANTDLCNSMVDNRQPTPTQLAVFRHIFKAGYLQGRTECIVERMAELTEDE